MRPTKLEQAINYKWDASNVNLLHRLLIDEVLELKRRLDDKQDTVGNMLQLNQQGWNVSIENPDISLYDSEPDGLEA